MRITHLTRTAKSAKAKVAVTLFSALAALGVSGAMLLGATAKPKFDVFVAPATQTVTAGQDVSYGITLQRDNKFTSPVALTVTGLPSNTAASFAPSTIPGSGTTSTLSMQTGASTTPGTYTLAIKGTSGSSQVTKTVRLVVLAPTAANFTLTPVPASGVMSEDDELSYSIAIERTGGFTGPVTFSLGQLPKNVTGTYYPSPATGDEATIELTSTENPKPGTYPLTVTGTAAIDGAQVSRSASIQLIVEEKKPFQITGAPSHELVPGVAAPVELILSNPHNFPLEVTEVAVAVGHQTSKAACDGVENYSVDQMTGVYPLVLPAGASRTLTQLGIADDDKPAVRMNDLISTNQDGCKGASVYLSYSGMATK